MKISRDRRPYRVAITIVSAVTLALAGCSGGGSGNAAKEEANSANTAELFTIPADQMAHVQVLQVQASSLTRSLRLTGAVA